MEALKSPLPVNKEEISDFEVSLQTAQNALDVYENTLGFEALVVSEFLFHFSLVQL
jgi:hypothetical protein